MDKKEVLKLISQRFKELEFAKKGRVFFIELQHITITFDISFSQWSRTYKLGIGIWYKELKDERSEMLANSCHLGHDLKNVLMKLDEKLVKIEPLFDFDNSDFEKVESQIDKVFSLISEKVLPYLNKFDDYVYMDKHFEEDIALRPFFIYFHGIDFYTKFFKKQASKKNLLNHSKY